MCPALGFCSCLHMSSQMFDDEEEDNKTFMTPKQTEIQRTQFARVQNNQPQSTQKLANETIFTIFDKSLMESNVSMSECSMIPTGSDLPNMSNDSMSSISMDSGVYNNTHSNRSSISSLDMSEEAATAQKKSVDKVKQLSFKQLFRRLEDFNFVHKLTESLRITVKECASLTYSVFSASSTTTKNRTKKNKRSNKYYATQLDEEFSSITLEDTSSMIQMESTSVIVSSESNRSLFLTGVTPLCHFFLRIYDTNFF